MDCCSCLLYIHNMYNMYNMCWSMLEELLVE